MADLDALIEDDDVMGGPMQEADLSDVDEMTEHDRAKLLRRISKITGKAVSGGKREIRKEASKDAAEFVVVKRKTGVAPTLSRLLTSVKESGEEKAAEKINKLVKAVTGKSVTTLDTPLEKPQALKTKREILYENAKQDVSRWNAIVYHNRVADQLVFPLNSGKKVARRTGKDAAGDFIPMTPLEEEMAKVLYGEDYLKQKKALLEKPQGPTDAEAYMLSVEEALANHSEMARLKALQSYQMVKAKRQNKIKSKKYHRLLRKEKIKKQLKDFESLQKTDPEAALLKLEELEKSRIQERMSLKHRNTSQWAKMHATRAKYDKESRAALSEQLKISHQLTQKVKEVSSDDEDLDLEIPQLVKSSVDNPWILQSDIKDNEKLQLYYTGYKKLWEDINARKQKEAKKLEVEQLETPTVDEIKVEPQNQVVKKLDDIAETSDVEIIDDQTMNTSNEDVPTKPQHTDKKQQPLKPPKRKKITEDKQSKKLKKKDKLQVDEDFASFDVDALVDKAEEKLRSKAQKQLKLMKKEELRKQKQAEKAKKKLRKNKKTKKQKEGDADEIREVRVDSKEQIVESAPGVREEIENLTSSSSPSVSAQMETTETSKKTPVLLNPNNFLKIGKSKNVKKFDGSQVEIDWGDEDEVIAQEEDAQESQRKLIAEAFEDDDVVDDFKKMKDSEIEASKPKDIDLHLPGWGDWGGQGVKLNPKKRQRFIIKAPKQPPRKDAKLSHVILNQEAGEKIRDHQVRELPFPFKRVKDFERTVRAPIGRTWMTEESVKSLTAPKVITRLGSVIEPMSEDVLVQTKNGQAKDLNVPVSIKRLAKVKK